MCSSHRLPGVTDAGGPGTALCDMLPALMIPAIPGRKAKLKESVGEHLSPPCLSLVSSAKPLRRAGVSTPCGYTEEACGRRPSQQTMNTSPKKPSLWSTRALTHAALSSLQIYSATSFFSFFLLLLCAYSPVASDLTDLQPCR